MAFEEEKFQKISRYCELFYVSRKSSYKKMEIILKEMDKKNT